VGDHKQMQAGELQLKQNELGNSKWQKSICLFLHAKYIVCYVQYVLLTV